MDGLPVLTLVIDALTEISTKWRILLKALILPSIAITFVEAIPANFPESFFWPLAPWALSAPLYVLFAVVCHRVVILGEYSLPSSNGLFWSERETRFFGWTIALIIVTWGLGLVSGLVVLLLPSKVLGMNAPWLPLMVIAAILSYCYVRLSLVFPATAVDQGTSLDDAMNLSTGNGLRMLTAVVIPILPLIGVEYIVSKFVDDRNGIAEYVVSEVIAYAAMIITICVISVIYRTLADLDFIEEAT